MGIHQLSKVITTHSKINKHPLSYYSNSFIAIDASLSIYQFLIAVRSEGTTLSADSGETSHLVGMFYRTIRMVSAGIRPLYVFDGLPPSLKLFELKKRLEKRETAIKDYEEAYEKGDKEALEKYDKRKVKVVKKHVDDCKKLLELLKIPFVTAPSEAESYCAYLCKNKVVSAVATEDMDALTFGAPILLRNLNAAESKKLPINEYRLDTILSDMELNMAEFIDMCILLGCDYCESVKGVGQMKAYQLIKKHKTIERIIECEQKIVFPENWKYKDARKIFVELPNLEGDKIANKNIKYDEIDVEEVVKFLSGEHGFSEDRVRKGVEKLKSNKGKGIQTKLDFFIKKQ
ncbi:Elongation of fatty acids protein 2 [Binucleata daphniae]